MTAEEIKNKYSERILKYLNEMREDILFENEFLTCSLPAEEDWDDFRWAMYVRPVDGTSEEGVDIQFIIAESESWDGEENGVNFMVDVVSYEGQMIGGLIPYNYSDDVWVSRDDEDAIEKRFKLVEDADVGDVSYLISEFYEVKKLT